MDFCEEEVIVEHLERVRSTTNTIWATAIEGFLKNPDIKEEDYIKLIEQIKEQIATSSESMQKILGDTYIFLKSMNYTIEYPLQIRNSVPS